jgi:hypothetical protein
MKLCEFHWSPRCGAKTRSGKKCRNGAKPNGRCKFHGGKAPSGRANGAFRTGKFTKQAIEDRIAAKLMRDAGIMTFSMADTALAKTKKQEQTQPQVQSSEVHSGGRSPAARAVL